MTSDREAMSKAATKAPVHKSRAVLRRVEAGSTSVCSHCDEPVKFAAKMQRNQVIANVYVSGKWNRVEHFHEECYIKGGEIYGTPSD